MPVHPQARAFLDMVADAPPLDTCTVEENRAQLAAVVPLTGEPAALAEVRDTTVPGPAGDLPVRVYRPTADDGLPAVAYFHGGGWVLGDLDTHDTTCRDLARYSGSVVVSVDYRRAPEAPFPAAFDDCLAVTRALLDGSAGLGTDSARVAVAGDSAGGNLAAGIAQALRGARPPLAHQVLIYPLVDASTGRTGSYDTYGDGHFLTHRDIDWFLTAYGGDADRSDPRLSPAVTTDLGGLAPATVVTAECDPPRRRGCRVRPGTGRGRRPDRVRVLRRAGAPLRAARWPHRRRARGTPAHRPPSGGVLRQRPGLPLRAGAVSRRQPGPAVTPARRAVLEQVAGRVPARSPDGVRVGVDAPRVVGVR